ncbi:hypothetical protein SARC_12331 [Sphaeroforma arctica JP610]|uniref:Exportin-1 C-terminal domain-containing protein n=1 Tax=Sphaeroforma arctica JP610 TaxID=667725 RepID=A0A0L0FEF1_9EUKA|nr:hypothetical protein SARC_12331 [Sphaeroforma arctica JP610]KNC75137.1 hypothetical protein SARC_12331 [Sphaeroforma arctica JP610]|eukprot:XP_014149039.1 hypothetical protein SARC_12331 [Sphaeroforma arctica JP610]
MLPRVMDLAENSSDRSTKVVACELFHAICLFLIGISANKTTDPALYTPLYQRVFPAIFRLAVDMESVARQLFELLAFQFKTYCDINALGSGSTTGELNNVLDLVKSRKARMTVLLSGETVRHQDNGCSEPVQTDLRS